jgi:hypothetical protein
LPAPALPQPYAHVAQPSPGHRFINVVIFHKPDEKADLSVKSGFKAVGTKAMLHKQYPPGGGILFRRYYGIGSGILVGIAEMETMMGDCDVKEWTAEMSFASPADLSTGQVQQRASMHAFIHPYVLQQVVEGDPNGVGDWAAATIAGIRADGTVDLQFYDDEVAFGVSPEHVRALERAKLGEDAPTRQRRRKATRERLKAEEAERARRAAEQLAVDERETRFENGRAAALARAATGSAAKGDRGGDKTDVEDTARAWVPIWQPATGGDRNVRPNNVQRAHVWGLCEQQAGRD